VLILRWNSVGDGIDADLRRYRDEIGPTVAAANSDYCGIGLSDNWSVNGILLIRLVDHETFDS